MMNIGIVQVLLELLAAIVIQFTPVEGYFNGSAFTWGDGASSWYILEAMDKGKGKVDFSFLLYEGEVNSGEKLVLQARTDGDGKYVWQSITRENDRSPQKFLKSFASPVSAAPELKAMTPDPWDEHPRYLPLMKKTFVQRNGEACVLLLYGADDEIFGVLLSKAGSLLGISASRFGKGYDDAEFRLEREGTAP